MIYADSSRPNTGRAHSPINSLASSRPILNASLEEWGRRGQGTHNRPRLTISFWIALYDGISMMW